MKTAQWILKAALSCSVLTVGSAFAGPGGEGGETRQKDPAKFFAKLDANGDGEVTKDEFTANAETRRRKIAERRAASGKGGKDGKTPPSPADIFSRLDADGDGALTQAEFTNGMANRKGKRQGK